MSPSMAGSRAGALIAAAWASMMSLGESGMSQSHVLIVDNYLHELFDAVRIFNMVCIILVQSWKRL